MTLLETIVSQCDDRALQAPVPGSISFIGRWIFTIIVSLSSLVNFMKKILFIRDSLRLHFVCSLMWMLYSCEN